jgi:signal transduction histidine kinase/HAMP domain-containing protein
MEIKKIPRQANQFWPAFFKKKLVIVILTQIIISLSVGAALVLTNTFAVSSTTLWIIVLALFIVSLAMNLVIFISSVRPTRDLLAAILNVAGERSTLTPPNPNNVSEHTGFRDALQTIYKLSGSQSITDTKSTEITTNPQQPTTVVTNALDMTSCGFVAFDNKRTIIYANKATPIHIDNNGVKVLDLLFNGTDTLDSWLDSCEEHSVHDEHIWTRVPDRMPDQENRHFFDVIASYQKGSATETVLTLIERTNMYIVDEENLDFISFAAHELRGPITVIRGYLDVLEDELGDTLKDDQRELFQRLVVSSNRLTGYINNILNTSRYDRRHLKVHLAEDTVAAVYDVISDDMKLRASSQNRLLTVNIPNDLPTIAVDRTSMSEVFGNLIDNAIKYSNEGGSISVTSKANGDFVEIAVQDNGIGMPENVVSNLFQKFYRSHRSRETVAGTGIGLYISKAIVESHGGTISVRSEEGKGSVFTVQLPIYATVADKLKAGDNSNEGIMSEGKGWIKNHSMFRG